MGAPGRTRSPSCSTGCWGSPSAAAARWRRSAATGAASLDVFCISLDHTKRDVLARRGYVVRRTIYRMGVDLTGDIPVQPPPDGIEIRPFREEQAAAMRDTMNEAFADHFRQSEEPFEAWKQRLLGHPIFDPGPVGDRLGRRRAGRVR